MKPLNFKYTITWTQTASPSRWDLASMKNHFIKMREQAYEAEAKLIEETMERNGYSDAQAIIKRIMEK